MRWAATAAAALLLAGCGGNDPQQAQTPEATTEVVTASPTATASASEAADQGDVMLCRTHDDIAQESGFSGRDEIGLDQLQNYVQDWMDDLETASRAARNKALIADIAEVNYELSVLNAQLQIALTTDDDLTAATEQIRTVADASKRAASTCRLQVGGADFRAVILESLA